MFSLKIHHNSKFVHTYKIYRIVGSDFYPKITRNKDKRRRTRCTDYLIVHSISNCTVDSGTSKDDDSIENFTHLPFVKDIAFYEVVTYIN